MNICELPQPILHHIQSFLNPKDAARTTLVSKSWSTTWSTRPIIDLNEADFHNHRYPSRSSNYIDPLTLFANNTFRRYKQSNLTIHTFRLRLKRDSYSTFGLAATWISKALKLRASDLTIICDYETIPIDQVFASQYVVSLCLHNLTIDPLMVLIECLSLKSLALTEVYMSLDSFFRVMDSCPLIEKLSFQSCLRDHEQISQTFFLCDLLASKFCFLKDLTITITFHYLHAVHNTLIISSRSLEILNIRVIGGGGYEKPNKMRRVELNLPSIRKFTFEGLCILEVCFSPPLPLVDDQSEDSRDDVSIINPNTFEGLCMPAEIMCVSDPIPISSSVHVSISHRGELNNRWFRELRKLLRKLRGSKIHLVINLEYYSTFSSSYQARYIKGSNAQQVEDLTIYTNHLSPEEYNSLLDGLFRICRPKTVITTRNNDLLLCHQALEQGLLGAERFSMRSQYMYGLRHLDQVYVLELRGKVWVLQPMESMSDDSTSEQIKFRFQLKWKPNVDYSSLITTCLLC